MVSGFLVEKLSRLCGPDFRKAKFEVTFRFHHNSYYYPYFTYKKTEAIDFVFRSAS